MVINRFLSGRRRFPRWKKGRRLNARNVFNYVVADSNRRRVKGQFRKYAPSTRHRFTSTTDISNITTTSQAFYLTDIDQGTGNQDRVSNHIKARSLRFRGLIEWDQVGTPAKALRFVVAAVEAREAPSIGLGTNIYGRVDAPSILHVYKDFRVVNKDANIDRQKINFQINFKDLAIKYNTNDGETTTRRDLVLFVVSDNASSTTDLTYVMRTFTWDE